MNKKHTGASIRIRAKIYACMHSVHALSLVFTILMHEMKKYPFGYKSSQRDSTDFQVDGLFRFTWLLYFINFLFYFILSIFYFILFHFILSILFINLYYKIIKVIPNDFQVDCLRRFLITALRCWVKETKRQQVSIPFKFQRETRRIERWNKKTRRHDVS